MELTREHRQVSQLSRQTKGKENKAPAEHVGSAKSKVTGEGNSPSGISFLNFIGGAGECGKGREVLKPWQFVEN